MGRCGCRNCRDAAPTGPPLDNPRSGDLTCGDPGSDSATGNERKAARHVYEFQRGQPDSGGPATSCHALSRPDSILSIHGECFIALHPRIRLLKSGYPGRIGFQCRQNFIRFCALLARNASQNLSLKPKSRKSSSNVISSLSWVMTASARISSPSVGNSANATTLL